MTDRSATDQELAKEALLWDGGKLTPAGWSDAPEAVPRTGESVPISIRLPRQMITILKEFAGRDGIGYQVLIKRWLDDRIRHEYGRRNRVVRLVNPVIVFQAAAFLPASSQKLTEEDGQEEMGKIASRLHLSK
jgi:hypothetical protein